MGSWNKVELNKLKTKCNKCNKPAELMVRVKMPQKIKHYTFNLATICTQCKVFYYYDGSKLHSVEKIKNRLIKLPKLKKNALVDYTIDPTDSFPSL